MKIAAFTFDDRVSGLGKRIRMVAVAIRNMGSLTTVICPDRGGNLASALAEDGIVTRRIRIAPTPNLRRPGSILQWLITLPRDVIRCRRRLKQTRPDVVHVNGAFFLAPAIAASTLRLPLVWHLNDTIMPASLARVFGRLVARLADHVVVAAVAVAEHYCIPLDRRSSVIYAPTQPIREALARRMPGPPWTVGLIGNISPVKGIADFLYIARELVDRCKNHINFRVAGSILDTQQAYVGEMLGLADELGLKDRLILEGHVDCIEEFLKHVHILLVTSKSEACPMAVLEAMATATPVVAFDVGGVRELLEEPRRSGIVVANRDRRLMSEEVLKLLSSEQQRGELGAAGRATVAERFSLDSCASRHLKAYTAAIEARDIVGGSMNP